MPDPRPVPDQAARDLIRARLDLNLLVEAGAGSGKTECLAQRMTAGVLAGHYTVEQIAAVTFTRKAAAELRGRFQLTLEKAAAAERDPARKERALQALRRLERLFAGTIHAFCAHLLRERPVEAGVAPGFTELDEIAQLDQQRRAWRDYLDRQRALGSPALRELVEAGVRPGDLDPAFEIVCTHADVVFPAGDAAARPDATEARAALERFWTQLGALLPGRITPDTTCPLQRSMRRFERRFRVAALEESRVVAELAAEWKSAPRIVQNRWAPGGREGQAVKARIEALFAELQQVTLPFLDAWYQYVYRLAMTLLMGGREHAADARRRAVTLNYGDLLQYAAALLRDDPEVRAALQGKYRWLFVDEFQDTDPVQAEVLLLLAAAASPERDWARVPLRPGALFVVGDPKQSIYRFRRADIDIYQRVRERIEASGGRVVTLTACFRSVPALCEWANAVFGRLFPEAATQHQPGFAELMAARSDRNPGYGVRVIKIPEGARGGAVNAFEAEAIARFIRSEVDARHRKPGDFLILTRVRKTLPIYTRALEALRLPVEVSGGAAFATSAAVGALSDLLQALTDPDDGPAVVGILRGPLFGISDRDLFRHRQAGGGFLITAPETDADGPVAQALRSLRTMYVWTRRLPAPAAVERILEATGLLAMTAATTPGGAEAGDLLHAVDRIRQVTEDGGTLADAAAALTDDLESPEVESVPLEPGRSDVVRVMNLHRAKGLEAPVVFLADPLRGTPDDVDVRIVREGVQATGYLEVRRKNEGAYGHTVLGRPAGWSLHQEKERAYLDAERVRLVYVAATRAKDLLVVGRPAKPNADGPWQQLAPYLMKVPALPTPPVSQLPLPTFPDLTAGARSAAAAAREARARTLQAPSWQVESVTGTAHRAGPYGHPLQEGRTREPDTGMAWGSLIHFLLEHAMRGPRRDRAHLERLAGWFAFDEPGLRRVIPEALDTVERVMTAPFWREATAARERAVEVPFAVRRDEPGAAPRLLHGVIDLAYAAADGWTLIDYKTDRLDAGVDTLVERYAPQIRAYAEQWRARIGGPTRAGLHFVRNGETRWLAGC